jgi:DNA polymerase III epsilon subunit-like protein
MVSEAPPVNEVLPSLLEFIGGSVLVGHNLRFDLSFLDHALLSSGRETLANATVDTLALARRLVRDMVPNCKLGTLASNLRLDHQPSHRALNDVLATGDLLHALLERAGSFGIVDLEELLDLPRLISHPQAGKLRLTVRLPHRPGVYWFTDAAGNVLYVGKATDLQARVRSYFTSDRRSKVGRLLRQLHTVHHRVCSGPLSAAVLEGRLIQAWSPLFNQQGKARRSRPRAGSVPDGVTSRPRAVRNRTRGFRWSSEDLVKDPIELLSPMVAELVELSHQQRYEEAANLRDQAERLRHLLLRHRVVDSLRTTGRLTLEIEEEGRVELEDGLLLGEGWRGGDLSRQETTPDSRNQSSVDQERAVIAQWLMANPERVRVIEVGTGVGLAMCSERIPELSELYGRDRSTTVVPPIPSLPVLPRPQVAIPG